MRNKSKLFGGLILLICLLMTASFSFAAVDKVICVPWQGDVNKHHTALSGTAVQLKCVVKTTDATAIYYKWVFGDGTPDTAIASLSGSTKYNIETNHTYTAAAGTPFTAQLIVDENNALASPVTDPYIIKIEDNTLDSRINIAIDKGLWWLYKAGNNLGGYAGWPGTYNALPYMAWLQTSYEDTLASPTASAVHAFGVNNHKIKGNINEDPYVEAVQQGMNYLVNGYSHGNTGCPELQAVAIGVQAGGNPEEGQAAPNGYGIQVYGCDGHIPYQGGQIMDAIIASGVSPSDLTGRDFAPSTPKSHNWTYGEVLQDMADMYAWGQYDGTGCNGGICGSWWYGWNYGYPGDNSASQWGAIGLIPAQQAPWNSIVPQWVKTNNANWLAYSMGGNNYFSYTSTGYCAGDNCFSTTTSGLVQMVLDGQIGYDDPGTPADERDSKWQRGQAHITNNWSGFLHNWSSWGNYNTYGFYSFAKAMRLALPHPVEQVKTGSTTFDWYRGDATNKGLATRILELQNSAGYFTGNLTNEPLTTAWMIITLKPTLFEASPTACFNITPNPNYPNQTAYFNPACSGHSETGKDINNLIKYEWDWDNNGTYDQATSTPDTTTHSFPCASLPCSYPVKLRVTDDSVPARTASAIVTVLISNPPHPPVSEAGGPYMTSMCAADTLTLDGSGSYDPNEGQHEAGCTTCPNDTVTKYEWDLKAPLTFDVINKADKKPVLNAANISSFFNVGGNSVGLRVTDNTALAYPLAYTPNLTSTDFATVDVKSGCICNLTSRVKDGKVQLNWTHMGAASYDIYRSTVGPNSGFTLIQAGLVTTYAVYIDTNVVNGQSYYYRVLASTGCGSNWVKATPTTRQPIDFRNLDRDGDGFTPNSGDCNDNNKNINPSAWDILDNGIDENCDGIFANSPLNTDDDHDGYTENQGDCNDTNASIHPNAAEVCNGKDDDCDVQIDEGVINTYYLDQDSDGFGDQAQATQACTAPAGYVANNTDCGPSDPNSNPGAAEVCDGTDNNCNVQIDEGVKNTYYPDADSDGYGDPANSIPGCTLPAGYASNNTDCNDSLSNVNPGAVEICDGYDNDCDGSIDEGVRNAYYQDADRDGYGDPLSILMDCVMPGGFVLDNSDCDDSLSSVYPGAAETCNGIDDNCNGIADDGVTYSNYYRDSDGDGYGDPVNSSLDCALRAGYVTDNTDCDDSRTDINPGAVEVCNTADDDCDGAADEGVKNTYYRDQDADGYGDVFSTEQACSAPAGYVTNTTDCDDSKSNVCPGAAEICDGLDNNCDGEIDEGVKSTYYQDQDSDGYGDAGNTTQACIAPAGYVSNNTDCGPIDSDIRPGAVEICDDGIDQNCDGSDLPCALLNVDGDSDGFTPNQGDCDDTNPNIRPGLAELCNGVDDNCNTQIDEGVKNTYYQDVDGDGYGAAANTTQACTAPAGYVSDNTDCDDDLSGINPGAYDFPGNGIDENCDGQDATGTGVAAMGVELEQNVINAGASMSFFDVFFDINGLEVTPGPNSTCAITLTLPAVQLQADAPTLSGGQINTSPNSRGTYKLTCSLPSSGISADAAFVVIAPTLPAVQSQAGLYGGLGNSLGSAANAMADLVKALQNGNLAGVSSLRNKLLAAKNAVDLRMMKRSTAFAPERGFPLTPGELSAAGYPAGPGDAAYGALITSIKDKVNEMTSFIKGIAPLSLTDATGTQINQLNSDLQALLNQFSSSNPSLNGIVTHSGKLNELLAVTLPNYLHALADKTSQALLLNGYASNQMSPMEMYADIGSADSVLHPSEYYSQINPAFFGLIDLMMGSSLQGQLINMVYGQAFRYLENAMIIMAANDLLGVFLNNGTLDGIVTGASVSFHVFDAGGSFIEGSIINLIPDRNSVYLIGPDQIEAVRTVLESITSLPESPEEIYGYFEAIVDALEGAGEAYDSAYQVPDDVYPNSCFMWSDSASCNMAYYNSGFGSVYECGWLCIPAPVMILVHNLDTEGWGWDLYNFIGN